MEMLIGCYTKTNMNSEHVCLSAVSVFVGPKPERELQISHDVHPGVKVRIQRHAAAELSGIPESVAQ